ncbi:MAG: hypothetical protein ACEPOV_05300 [Hyphomicrobiales bacterium]
MIKKIIPFCLYILLGISFISCSKDDTSDPTSIPNEETETKTTLKSIKKDTITAFSVTYNADKYISSIIDSIDNKKHQFTYYKDGKLWETTSYEKENNQYKLVERNTFKYENTFIIKKTYLNVNNQLTIADSTKYFLAKTKDDSEYKIDSLVHIQLKDSKAEYCKYTWDKTRSNITSIITYNNDKQKHSELNVTLNEKANLFNKAKLELYNASPVLNLFSFGTNNASLIDHKYMTAGTETDYSITSTYKYNSDKLISKFTISSSKADHTKYTGEYEVEYQ